MKRAFICTLLALQPALAWAEGAVRILDCAVTQVCDAAGACEPASDRIEFRMEPGKLDDSGRGTYTLRYADVQVPMEADSYAGPFTWQLGAERHTLLANSETQFLWHQLALDEAPAATVRFLECMVEQ